jgi:Flp pilus assembly protein TadG
VVSLGSFLALTGAFAVKTTVAGTAATSATTGTTGTTVVTTDDDNTIAINTSGASDLDTDDWSGTAATASNTSSNTSASTSSNTSSGSTAPATTQSNGS